MLTPDTTPPREATAPTPVLSIVTSVYRSEQFITRFIDEMTTAIGEAGIERYEMVFVNDGSPDESLLQLIHARSKNPAIKIVDLSRNFGHHKALMAGLTHAKGDLLFLIDCDLEVRPGVLPSFLETFRGTGADVVYGIQGKRKRQNVSRRTGGVCSEWRG